MVEISKTAIENQLWQLYFVCNGTGEKRADWIYMDVEDYVFRKASAEYVKSFINLSRDRLVKTVDQLLRGRNLTQDQVIKSFNHAHKS